MADVVATITITGSDNKGYKACVDPVSLGAKRGHKVKWSVIDDSTDFPKQAKVYVQFVTDDGCLVDGKKNKGRYLASRKTNGKDHNLGSQIAYDAGQYGQAFPYSYMLGYQYQGVDYPLVDPEIVVEGDANVAGVVTQLSVALQALKRGQRLLAKAQRSSKRIAKAKRR